jgi:hypothetical protein
LARRKISPWQAYREYHRLFPPIDLRDRDIEIWKPLFSICQVFCPERIEELAYSAADMSAMKTQPARKMADLTGIEEKQMRMEYSNWLVKDAMTVIGDKDKIPTAELLEALKALPTSPWRKWQGRGLTVESLAALFGVQGVKPCLIRFGKQVARG